jgi:hypothetical protein
LSKFPSCGSADFVDIANSYGRKRNVPYGVACGVHCGHCWRVEVFLPDVHDYKNNSPRGEELNHYPQYSAKTDNFSNKTITFLGVYQFL